MRHNNADAEAKYAWLPIVLDAYDVADQGTEKTIKDLNESGATVACGNGCDACCRNGLCSDGGIAKLARVV